MKRTRNPAPAGVCSLIVAMSLAACGGDDRTSVSVQASPPAATDGPVAASVNCESLRTLQLPHTTINAAQSVAAGAYQPPGSASSFADLPSFCRVTATLTPVPGSSIAIELWLPSASWNGRYQQVGSHGWGRGIEWGEMAPQLRRGFVAAATDNGHAPTPGFDVSWVPGFPERLTDFAYRAVHETAVSAKSILNAYYARPASRAYFNGCSTGGREGLMSAQRYPQDFDGIIAGSALQNWTRIATQEFFVSQQLLRSGIHGTAGAGLLTLARNAAVATCDAADGVVDGIIRDPSTCRWSPRALLCQPGQDAATCLTAPQADALTASFAPLTDPVTREVLFAGQSVSAEGDWVRFGYQNGLFSLPIAQYRIAFNDFSWDGSTFDLHADLPVLERSQAGANAIDPDMTAFSKAGGKLIQWHGWEDGVSMPGAIVASYDQVRDVTYGGDRAAQQKTHRLFMLPGVSHCGGGPGPANFGAEGQAVVAADAQHDAVQALQDWVEKGSAPEQFIATKFQGDDPTKAVTMQRPLCAHPAQAVYKGSGDTNDASNFRCG